MTRTIDQVLADWRSIGIAIPGCVGRVGRADQLDLERLLLDTARTLPKMSRLHVMAVTWLHLYGELVAKHRLRRLIADELEERDRPVLGVLLDTAQLGLHPRPFDAIVDRLPPASDPAPLFIEAAEDPAIAAIVRRRSSAVARRWRRWAQPVDLKFDALRPPEWIRHRWPEFVVRADWRGDLRASVMASLRFDRGAGDSEVRLAACAGGSRAQIRNALRNLQMSGRVELRKADGANRTEIRWVDSTVAEESARERPRKASAAR